MKKSLIYCFFRAKTRREMCGGKDNTKLKVSHIVVNSPYFFCRLWWNLVKKLYFCILIITYRHTNKKYGKQGFKSDKVSAC